MDTKVRYFELTMWPHMRAGYNLARWLVRNDHDAEDIVQESFLKAYKAQESFRAAPLLHARLDNELDMAGSASLDLHLAGCHACAAQYAALQNLHEEIIALHLAYPPGAALEQNLEARFLREKRSPSRSWFNASVASFMGGAAIAVIVLMVSFPLLRTSREPDASAEILDDHLRALQPMHQVDVPSSDQHTVKPWFQGKTNFSPPVPDLSKDGFVLLGGRLEVIHQQLAAAIIYRLRQHIVSLYIAPSQGPDSKTELRELGGYHLLHWTQSNLSYWAVSDVDPADLRTFAELVRR